MITGGDSKSVGVAALSPVERCGVHEEEGLKKSGEVLIVLLDTEACPLGGLVVENLEEVPMINGLCSLLLSAISKAKLVV